MDAFFQKLDAQRTKYAGQIPPKAEAHALAEAIFDFLFPFQNTESKRAGAQFTRLRYDLLTLLRPLLKEPNSSPEVVADAFLTQLPVVHEALLDDAQAFLRFDPAATCWEEVVATYPGFHAIAIHRIAHVLHRLRVPLLPRIFSEHVHSLTGIDIHPAATIGRSFFIDHGTGVVIGATTVIGENVKIYQGVTLGALQVDKSLANVKRHPTIGDNVTLYANSTILGGRTEIGHDSVIGGNTWLTESVPPFSVVLNQAQAAVRTRPFDEPVNFVI